LKNNVFWELRIFFKVDNDMRQIVANVTAQVLPTIQKHWIEGVIGLGAIGIVGLVYFQAGKTVTAIVPWAVEFVHEGASASADYADFKKVCEKTGGVNTWNPLWPSATLTSGVLPVSCYTKNPEGLLKAFPGRVETRTMPPSGR
jgi:hypothetical protein